MSRLFWLAAILAVLGANPAGIAPAQDAQLNTVPVAAEDLIARDPPIRIEPDWNISNLAESAGLARQQIRVATFDRDGTIWIGAGRGVYRYDGFRSEFWGEDEGVPGQVVNGLLVDRQGKLWVSSSHGVATFDPKSRRFHSFELIGDQAIGRIYQGGDGSIWFCGGEQGLLQLKSGRMQPHDVKACLPYGSILSYFEDSAGRRFVLSTSGLAQQTDQGWVAPLTSTDLEGIDGTFRSAAQAADGSIVFTTDSAIFILRKDRWSMTPVDRIHQVIADERGEIYSIAPVRYRSDRYFAFFRWDGGVFNKASAEFRMPKNWSYWHGLSPDGSLWMASYNRLVRWPRDRTQWSVFDEEIRPQFIDAAGRLWFSGYGTAEVLDGPEWLHLERVSWPFEGRDGVIWFHSPNGVPDEIIRVDGRHVTRQPVAETGLQESDEICTDGMGRVWVTGKDAQKRPTVAGRYEGAWTTTAVGNEHQQIRDTVGDTTSGIWVVLTPIEENVSPQVVGVRDHELIAAPKLPELQPALYPELNIKLLCDGGGRIWLKWMDQLFLWDATDDDQWHEVTEHLGGVLRGWCYKNNNTYFAISSEWGGQSGLVRFSSAGWQPIGGAEPTWFDRWKLNSHVIGADSEFYQINDDDILRISLPFEDASFNGLAESDGTVWLSVRGMLLRFQSDGVPPETQIRYAPGSISPEDSFRMQVSATTRFSDSRQPPIQFQRRVDGGQWSELLSAEEASELQGSAFKTGRHRIEIRAIDESGDTEQTPEIADFEIRLPVWRQPWFVALMTFLVGVILAQTARVILHGKQIRLAEEELRRKEVLAEMNLMLEQKVADRTASLRETNEELKAFAHSVSHDLRAPLRAMEGFAVALSEDFGESLGSTGTKYIGYIVESAKRMDDLVNGLLEYSRLGREKIVISRVSLNRAVPEALQRLEVPIRECQARIDIPDSLPVVMAHHGTVVQILQNLISNAIKFVPEGATPHVELSVDRHDEMVRVTIKDNGIGISAEYHEKIFAVFERLHGRESYQGTGIGLAIVSRSCNRLGGRCGLNSEPGNGSSFWFELPAQGAES